MHRSVRALAAAIDEFIAAHNDSGAPFVWTKTADEILASIARFARRALNLTQPPEHRLRIPMFYPTELRAHRLRLSLSATMFRYLLGRTAGIIVASGGVAQAATTTDICPWALRVRVTRISTL